MCVRVQADTKQIRVMVCDNGKTIEYELSRKNVKNINLRIDAAGTVKVSAAECVPLKFIESFMIERQDFIFAALEKMQMRREQELANQEKRSSRSYTDGEQFRILGKTLELKVIKSEAEGIVSGDRYLTMYVKKPENIRHKELLFDGWLNAYRAELYEKICRQVYEQFFLLGVTQFPVIKIRRMRSRWGSCHPYKKIITLNSRLIETPVCCIEYVVTHEFSHFIYQDHSKRFHALMTRLMPDWKERKHLLDSIYEWN